MAARSRRAVSRRIEYRQQGYWAAGMLNWRELLGLKPTVASLAQALIDRARARGDHKWTFDPERLAIRHADDGTINLTNIFLEYSNAPRAIRRELLGKYEAMMQQAHVETPKL